MDLTEFQAKQARELAEFKAQQETKARVIALGAPEPLSVGKLFDELGTASRVKLVTQTAGAATTGHYASAATTGDYASAATTGHYASAATTGHCANAITTGHCANAATTGHCANAITTGPCANAATTGDYANATTIGDYANAATTGAHAVAASLGIEAKAKASAGGAIVLAWRDQHGKLLGIRSAMIGEGGVQADVWYALNDNGEFTQAPQEH